MILNLTREAEKTSEKLNDEGVKANETVILHPQVWKNKEDAIKASTDIDFRKKSEILKSFEGKIGLK